MNSSVGNTTNKQYTQLNKKIQDSIKVAPKTTANVPHIFGCARYASEAYLSTVLYRYFLPFITIEEEKRILNGMETFMRTLLIAHWNAFSWDKVNSDNSLVNIVLKAVRETLTEVLAETVSDNISSS